MNYEYIAAGNVMLDTVRFADGKESAREHIGGPSTFAYSGIKLFTDKVMQVSKVGADYSELFDPWMEKNGVERAGFKVVCDHCNHSYLVYNEDGTYGGDMSIERFRSDWIQDFGYMKTTPEEIGEWTSKGGFKGLYLAQNVDRVFWHKLDEIKKRDGFKMMWEMESPSSYKKYMDDVKMAMRISDIFSINIQEARTLFDCETEEECIENLQAMPTAFTLFRVGARGLYAVTPDECYYLPSAPSDRVIDPTGCGNTSTGSALYAFCEGYDPLMVGIMANVGAAMNIRNYGVMPNFSEVRDLAFKQANELYKEYKQKYGVK